ncbi:MAG: hypothetical protein SH850_24510 [Planctomycetaceae bacterium]|nr:hypothetical protein [Planctomycetaceae bacterium]
MAAFVLTLCGCGGVTVSNTARSPDGRWMVSAEFQHDTGDGLVVIRDTSGKEVSRFKCGTFDEPNDLLDYTMGLSISNDLVRLRLHTGTVQAEWTRDPVSDVWRMSGPIPRD